MAHGLTGIRLHDVVRSTTVARMLYSSPAWWGFANEGERGRLCAIIRKLIRQGFLPSNAPTFDMLCSKADQTLFAALSMTPDMSYIIYSRQNGSLDTPLDLALIILRYRAVIC